MQGLKKAKITYHTGDGKLLRALPKPLARSFRTMGLKSRKQRQHRLIRTSARIFPVLKSIEEATIPQDQRLLPGQKFSQAAANDHMIERCLILFRVAWQTGLVEIHEYGFKDDILTPGDTRTPVGACGMSIGAVERFYLYRAARLIMRKHPKVQLDTKGLITGPEALDKLRQLAKMEPRALYNLQQGLGSRFSALLTPSEANLLTAVTKLKSFHVEGLKEGMGARFGQLVDWGPELIAAVAESFVCPEQLKDLGEYILVVKGPDAIRALGRWEIRDMSAKENEEREQRGAPKVSGTAYETDIGVIHKMLGAEFSVLAEQPAGLLDSVNKLIKTIRDEGGKRAKIERVEEFKQFVKRYLSYMTPEAIDALRMDDPSGDESKMLSIKDALGILEGIWTKEGVGRKFFNSIDTPRAITALSGLVEEYMEMKRRGSIKADSDIAAIISGSDLFDHHLQAYLTAASSTSLELGLD